MRPSAKRYSTSYKKKVDVERDMYLPRRSPKGIIQCTGCGAFYHRRHWTLAAPPGFIKPLHPHPVYCPACKKTKDRYPAGELRMVGLAGTERVAALRLIRNEEERAQEKNPLERIMALTSADGSWRVETTTEKLAQRLGRALKKARGGTVRYQWSHNNKYVRVEWKKRQSG